MIEAKGIKKSFSNNLVLDGIDLKIKNGSITTLIGKNGSGKTTLIKIIANILCSDSGKILIDNDEIDLNFNHQKKMGYVFDEPIFINSFSILEFFSFTLYMQDMNLKKYRYRIIDLCDLFELPINSRIDTLSKGQKMKASFACSLLHKPNNLIMDEPLGGIDPISIPKILFILFKLKENGVSILISSHRIEILESICDVYSFIDEGKIQDIPKNEFDLNLFKKRDSLEDKTASSISTDIDFDVPSWVYKR